MNCLLAWSRGGGGGGWTRRWPRGGAWCARREASAGRGVAWLGALVENEGRLGVLRPGSSSGRVAWGTEELARVLEGFGSPQACRGPWAYHVVRVAGSKGKGTVARALGAVVQRSGYRVGLYTSPHTRHVRERVAVNGVMVTEGQWEALADACRAMCVALGARLTRFEAMTAMALVHFREERVDVAVLECGLGGAEDATAVAAPPAVSVVTGVEPTEHREQLGGTAKRMWWHKVGVAHEGRPVVLGPGGTAGSRGGAWGNMCSDWGRSRYALPMTLELGAHAIGVEMPRMERSPVGHPPSHDEGGGDVGPERNTRDLWVPLVGGGGGAVENAATVASAAEVLAATVCPRISPQVVAEVLRERQGHAGSLFVHPDKDLAVSLDSAHSPASSAAAAASPLGQAMRERPGGISAVVAMARDKDARGFAYNMGRVGRLVVTEVPVAGASDRSMPAEALAAAWEDVRPGEADCVTVISVDPELNARLALAEAVRLAPRGSAVCITGSNHLLSRSLDALAVAEGD